MGTLSVKFNGKSAFDWTGDKAEIDGLGAAFRTAAKNVKLKPDVFADNAVRHFAESGFLTRSGRAGNADDGDRLFYPVA